MGKSHLKRLNAPKSWPISRKRNMWITRPSSGPHKLVESMPLNTILKELLKYPKITKEVKNILNKKEILVDKIPRKDIGFPVGIYDVIEIPKTKEYFLWNIFLLILLTSGLTKISSLCLRGHLSCIFSAFLAFCLPSMILKIFFSF